MKKIEAIIRSSRFIQVKEALQEEGIEFFTFQDVKGVGNQKNDTMVYRGATYDFGSIARTQLTIVVREDLKDQIIKSIMEHAYTGETGDGKIFVSTIEEAYRIRTGETNEEALDTHARSSLS